MNAPKHTPGPWKANPFCPERRTRGIWGGAPSPHLTYIATVGAVLHGTRIDEETEANARLIAAAPDMLTAIRNFLDTWYGPDHNGPTGEAAELRAALAKAEGPQS